MPALCPEAPEMTLRAPGDVPPTRLPGDSSMTTPVGLVSAEAPAASVPMKFPSITLPKVLTVRNERLHPERKPLSPGAASWTSRLQVPEAVRPLSADRGCSGMYAPGKGALPALIGVTAWSSKIVLV